MTGLYAFNVLVRSLAPRYASEIAWIDEAARYAMIWVVFLATGIALEIGRHVSVDLLRGRLPPAQERFLFAVIDVVGLAFSAGGSVVAFQLAWFVRETGQVNPTLGVPTYVLYLAPAYGLASMALRFLLRLLGLRDARRQPVAAPWLGDGRA